MKYIAVIGDIVSSRRVAHRARLQTTMKEVLESLNRRSKVGMVSPYTITIGDEFQALFTRADDIFHHAAEILAALDPVKARFSLGIGTLETPINRAQAIGMDGAAFHEARRGLEELRERQSIFSVTGLDKPSDGLTTQSLDLVSHLVLHWKKSRIQVLAMLAQQVPVKEIAARMRISDKAVYKSIDAGALRTVLLLFHNITLLINAEIAKK